jgi:pantoate kinase
MTENAVQELVSNLVKNPAFREQFKSTRTQVLNEADLSQDERKALEQIDVDELTATVAKLNDMLPAAVGSLHI